MDKGFATVSEKRPRGASGWLPNDHSMLRKDIPVHPTDIHFDKDDDLTLDGFQMTTPC